MAVFHAGLLRRAWRERARSMMPGEDGVPEPSSTYQEVVIWEIEEMNSLIGGLCALGTEA